MYKLICFDLDGTLLNSISDIALSMNKVLLNYNLPTYEVIEYKKFIGNGSKKLVQRAALDNYTDEMLEQYSNIYNNNATVTSEEYEDVTKTLLNLKTKYKLAVITNKPHDLANEVVSHYFNNIFDYVLGQQDNIAAKPNVDMMDIVLKEFNETSNNTLYIGDSEVDYNFALNSNVDRYIVTHGYGGETFLNNLEEKIKINKISDILNKL